MKKQPIYQIHVQNEWGSIIRFTTLVYPETIMKRSNQFTSKSVQEVDLLDFPLHSHLKIATASKEQKTIGQNPTISLIICIGDFISHYKIIIMNKKASLERMGAIENQENHDPNQSQAQLMYGAPQAHIFASPTKSIEQGQEQLHVDFQAQKQEMRRLKKEGLDNLGKESYKPAMFSKAVEYHNSYSYMKKLPSGHYKELDTFENTQELKYFGLGIYFYIQFARRLMWLFLIMSLIQGITIYINWLGSGMADYALSFSTYLIKSTVGNYSQNQLTAYDGYIVTIIPAVNYVALMLFYFIWKGHYLKTISNQQKDDSDVRPEKFCLQISGLSQGYVNQDELKKYFTSFGPVYEISLVRRYKNKLSYFRELDELEQKIREEQLQIVLGGGNSEKLQSLKNDKDILNSYINTLQIQPKTVSAFVHFQHEYSKVDCLNAFNDNYLFDTCSHNCVRGVCCCCLQDLEPKYFFHGQKLLIKSEKVPTPEDIEWGSFELTSCSKFWRVIFSFIIILVFLAISCSIIGLCSIYINSHSSSCQGITIPSTAAAASATGNSTIIQCYCQSNLIQSFTDSTISSACSSYLSNIFISQGIQYAVIITSSLTNFIFGVFVDKLVSCVRPESKSSGLLTKTVVYTIFIIFNTVFVPVLIYADIFGFQPSNYISFITIISSDIKAFFSFESLSFIPGFTTLWYRNVSPIFTNFLIIDSVMSWVFLIIDKCLSRYSSLQNSEGKILQKHMNAKITSYRLQIFKEASSLYLVVFLVTLFYAGAPALLPLGLLSIFSRYVTNRILLQNNSSRIEGLTQNFMSFSITILAIMLICFPIVGEWMLVANSAIYPGVLNMTLPILNGYFTELDQQLYLPFFIIISIIVFVEFFFYNTLVRCCSWLCSLCYARKEVVPVQEMRQFAEHAQGMNVTYSYNIRNNDAMRNAILNLEKYLVDKEMP